MKGTLLKSKALTDEWMVRYTTYKTIPGTKGVMGSHSRLPESNYISLHPDNILYLCPGDNGAVINFEIVPVCNNCGRDYCDNLACRGEKDIQYAKLVNEEKSTKRSKQKKYTNIMEHNNVEKLLNVEKACTQAIVDEAMRITSKDVRSPKCVRDGIVKRMYTEDDIREAIDMARMLSHVSCLEEGEHRLKYSNTEEDIIKSLK
jgi:hypothetical protein